MVDLMVSFGRLQPPFAKAPFKAGHLELLIEEVDLAAERLALLIHGTIPVDFCHETPVVDGEFVEFSTERGEGSSAPTKGGYKPCW